MYMKMPHTIRAYVQATNTRDHDAFGALFTSDAIVHDEGQEHRGVAARSMPACGSRQAYLRLGVGADSTSCGW